MKKYLFLLLTLLLCRFLYAQQGEIIYTDFEPDIRKVYTSSNILYDTAVVFDLDHDGIDEWLFERMGGDHGIGGFWLGFRPMSEVHIQRLTLWNITDGFVQDNSILATR